MEKLIKKSKQFVLFIVLGIFFTSHAQEWNQDSLQTKVGFIIKNFGINVDGNFSQARINTNFNVNQLSESYINAEIKVKSVDTGIKSRDEHILKEAYFDEKNHKKILLKSSKIEKNNDGTFSLFANLIMKGVTKKIKVPLEVFENKERLNISANFSINRKDFKISGGGFVLSNEVKINVNYKGTK